jgi:hypothetical protein
MLKRIIASAGLFIIAGTTSGLAQHRVEVSGFGGWSFADGVSGQPITAGNGGVYERVDPKDSVVYGFSAGYFVTESTEVGFMYTRMSSNLVFGGAQFSGTPDFELGDLSVSNYHGYLGYNFLEVDRVVRPFLYGGMGATHFGGVDFNLPLVSGSTRSETQFSTTWGVGVKIFPAPRFGIRVATSWTPTYIKSDAAGWWCDPFWGCYLLGDAQYSNQFHLTGGVTVRF